MSVYRRQWRDSKGIARTAKVYTIDVRHPETGKLIRVRGYEDKQSSRAKEVRLKKELAQVAEGIIAPKASTPLLDLLERFLDTKKVEGRDDMYIYNTDKRLRRMFGDTGWTSLHDITPQAWERWRNIAAKSGFRGKATSAKTLNQYLDHLKTFLAWCRRQGHIKGNPLEDQPKAKVFTDDDYRRAATPDEIRTFISSVKKERRNFYIVAMMTALRRGTLEELTWDDVKLDTSPPHIQIHSRINKGGRPEVTYLRADVVELLRTMRGNTAGHNKVFPFAPKPCTVKKDVERAGLQYADKKGRNRLDLHAYRKTVREWLRESGQPIHVAQQVLHHAHQSTTEKHYSVKAHDVSKAMDGLPSVWIERK